MLKEKLIERTRTDETVISTLIAKAGKDIEASETLFEADNYDWSYKASYTSILDSIKAYMNRKGYRSTREGGHVAAVEFIKIYDPDLKKYAQRIDRMRRLRHRITYDEYDIITETDAENKLKIAKEFLSLVELKLK